MRLLGLHHFAFNVRDLTRAEKFYTDILGFKVVNRYDDEDLGHIELDIGNVLLALFETPELDMEAALDTLSGKGFLHFAFQTSKEDLESIIQELRDHQIPLKGPVQLGKGMSIYFQDPDNNHLEIRYQYKCH